MAFEEIIHYSMAIQPASETTADEIALKLQRLNAALNEQWAHVARDKSSARVVFLKTNGCYTVVASKPGHAIKIQEIIKGAGFRANSQVIVDYPPKGRKTGRHVYETVLQFLSLVSV